MSNTIISLGSRCQIAVQIRKNNLRKEAFPFDWMITDNTEGLILLFEEDAKHLFDRKYMVFEEFAWGCKVFHTRYQLDFVHEFRTPEEWNSQVHFKTEKDKFFRRYWRLINILKSTETVHLVRKHTIDSEERERLQDYMNTRFQKKVSILFLVPTFSPFCKFSEYHAANLSHQNTLIPLARLMEKNKEEEKSNTKIWKIDYVCVSNQNSEDQDEEWKMIFESLLS